MSKLELLEEIRTLSAGTILSICRTSGVKINNTYEDIDRVVSDWHEFEKSSDITKKNWMQSWNVYIEELINNKDRLNKLLTR